jgi:hypothetical protein
MPKRIGVEWVNNYHGRNTDLKNRDKNAEGFINHLSGIKSFDYGDDLAWDTDFEQQGAGNPPEGSDTVHADNVDIVYFSGHGLISFGVANHDDGWATPREMALGNGRCRYLVIDACDAMSGPATTRWKPVFNGLRAMFGFVTHAYDVPDRGEKFANYLNAGHYMDYAWIWACQETEDSACQWGYIHTLTPANSYFDKWTDPSPAAVPNPTLHFHSGAC